MFYILAVCFWSRTTICASDKTVCNYLEIDNTFSDINDIVTILSEILKIFCCYKSDFYTQFVKQMNFHREESMMRYFWYRFFLLLTTLCFDY